MESLRRREPSDEEDEEGCDEEDMVRDEGGDGDDYDLDQKKERKEINEYKRER